MASLKWFMHKKVSDNSVNFWEITQAIVHPVDFEIYLLVLLTEQ